MGYSFNLNLDFILGLYFLNGHWLTHFVTLFNSVALSTLSPSVKYTKKGWGGLLEKL